MIALFGGTFDPVHNGHVGCARDLARHMGLDECRLLPCCRPPHRAPARASAEDRLAMLRLAVAGSSLVADDADIRRGGISYAVDSLAALRRRAGAKTPLYWIVGADSYAGMRAWHRADEILGLAHVIALARPGSPLPELPVWRAKDRDASAPCGHAWQLRLSEIDVSSSAVRATLAAGRPPDSDALPAAVLSYIEAKRLYAA